MRLLGCVLWTRKKISPPSRLTPPRNRRVCAQLRDELRRWVDHCLKMDTALNAAEKRSAELDRRLRGRESDSNPPSSVEPKDERRTRATPKQHVDSDAESTSSADRTPTATPGREAPSSADPWAPAPMSQEVHKALVEQSLLPAGRAPGGGRNAAGRNAAAGPRRSA